MGDELHETCSLKENEKSIMVVELKDQVKKLEEQVKNLEEHVKRLSETNMALQETIVRQTMLNVGTISIEPIKKDR